MKFYSWILFLWGTTLSRKMEQYRTDPGRITFAVPKKGRLYENTIKLLTGAGITYKRQPRVDWAWVDANVGLPIRLIFLNTCDIPKFVSLGDVQLGICGLDYMHEYEAGAEGRAAILEKLNYGKCDVAIQIPERSEVTNPLQLIGKRIVTSFPSMTNRYFNDLWRNSPAGAQALAQGDKTQPTENMVSVHTVAGSVEASIELGLGEAIVDLLETGETMRAARLRQLSTVLQTEAALIANPGLIESPAILRQHSGNLPADADNALPHIPKQDPAAMGRTITLIRKRVLGYLNASKYVYLAYNCETAKTEQLTKITPGMAGADVTPLEGKKGWVAVKSMIEASRVHRAIDQLEEAGAKHILATSITIYRDGT